MASLPSPHSRAYHDLLEALSQAGCPICRLGQQVAAQHLDRLLYESVNDPGVRERIRTARGLCHRHAWMMAAIRGGNLGIALIYRDVLDTVLQELGRETSDERRRLWPLSPSEGAEVAGRLAPQGPCPVCVHQEEMERIYLRELLRRLGDARLEPAFASSAGLCLPHLRQALAQAGDDEQRRSLLAAQRAIWQRLLAELNEFIRKNDYRFRHEGFGPEGDSWLRALASLSGDR
ncbi:MAG: DUF6062 family protein [Anaerolineae bacterium]|nr:DUF6062 family protein [Anaerolineae bacterium]MDW8099512.1 DUF6062 family protein [Anaerolineae bacterium]